MNRITMFDTTTFLLKLEHHLWSRKYKADHRIIDKIKNVSGNIADKKTFNIDGDGVKSSRFEFCTNQSSEINGSEADPILSTG